MSTEEKNFPFQKLPRELRNQIYHLTLISRSDGALGPSTAPAGITTNANDIKQIHPDIAINLLHTNKLIRSEVAPIFYGRNLFHFDASAIKTHQDAMKYELTDFFADNLEHFRKIRVRFSPSDLRTTKNGKKPLAIERDYSSHEQNKYNKILGATWTQIIDALKRMPLVYLEIDWAGCMTLYRTRLLWNPAMLSYFASPAMPQSSNNSMYHWQNQTKLARIVNNNKRNHSKTEKPAVVLKLSHEERLSHDWVHNYGFKCEFCAPGRSLEMAAKVAFLQRWVQRYSHKPECLAMAGDGSLWEQ